MKRLTALLGCLVATLAGSGALGSDQEAVHPRPEERPGPHPTIAAIRIIRSDVFDLEANPHDRHFPYTTLNRLHIDTREHVIRRELLFREGDPADPDVLYESERNLRRLNFLHQNTWIETVPRDDGRVDVVVRTRDTWTTRPQISFSREGNRSTGRFSFVESNVAGFGKTAGISFKRELDRDSGGMNYSDPRLIGTWWALDASYFSRSDGLIYTLDARRPFYSLLTREAGGGGGTHFSQVTTLQLDGEDAPGFRQRHTMGYLEYGRALRASYDRADRLFFRFRLMDDRFAVEPGEPPLASAEPLGGAGYVALPEDRRFRILEVEYQRHGVDFSTVNFLDKFDRYEDLNFDAEWSAWAGISPTLLGDRHNHFFFGGRFQRWHRPSANNYLRTSAYVEGRYLSGVARNVVGGIDFLHYYLGFPRQTLVFHLDHSWGHNLDGDRQFVLGGETGLRGYDDRRFDGNKRLLLNVEDRAYLVFDWLHLLSIGVAAFADAGYVWRAGESEDLGDLVADIGVGLRFDLTRSGTGATLRIDYAFPLNRVGREENPRGVVSIVSGHAF
jgi:hypothetical protein